MVHSHFELAPGGLMARGDHLTRRRTVSDLMRVVTPYGWSVELPDDFQEKANPDSWQSFSADGSRVVYIAELKVVGVTPEPTAEEIVARAMKDAADTTDFRADDVVGRIKVTEQGDTWVVNGICAVTGRMVTPTVSVKSAADVVWAVDVCRSLRFDGEPPQTKHRWFRR